MSYSSDFMYGYFLPNTTRYVGQLARNRDFNQFRRDHYKNTGRHIKYSAMRGYDKRLLAAELGSGARDLTNSVANTIMSGGKLATGWNGKTVRSIMYG